jgi:hypothetical protein
MTKQEAIEKFLLVWCDDLPWEPQCDCDYCDSVSDAIENLRATSDAITQSPNHEITQ